jgi:Flp pilus assembly protein TadG
MRRAMLAHVRRLPGALTRFGGECRGMAAVEFAMLLPLMMTLFLGSVEVSTGTAIKRKVTLTAHAVADLSSRSPSITNAGMTNILNASSAIIAPYAAAGLQTVVSELSVDANGVATVVWSNTLNGTARPVGETVELPASMAVPNTYLLLGEAQYTYNPPYGYVITGPITMKDQTIMLPRQSNSVQRTS